MMDVARTPVCGRPTVGSTRVSKPTNLPDIVSVIQVSSTGRADCSVIGSSAVHKPVPTMLIVNMIFPPYFWMRNPAGI